MNAYSHPRVHRDGPGSAGAADTGSAGAAVDFNVLCPPREGRRWWRASAVRSAAVLLVASAALVASPGCKPGAKSGGDSSTSAASSEPGKPGEKRFPITGVIVKVDQERKTLLVNHDEIPNYMPAMTMEFAVTPGDLAIAQEGQKIRAEMIQAESGDFRLEKIWPDDRTAASTVEAAGKALAQDTHVRGKNVYREVGENLPDFALYDQTGKVVSAQRFRGKKVMMNFIFSRCPVATMCPAATANMMATQRAAKEAGASNVEFVSITLDPEYDTPGVLKDYAESRGVDTSNFSFLTGPESAIKNLLAQFGVLAEFDGSILKHTLATLLIDEQGKIIWRADGSNWSPKDFVGKMRKS